MADDNTNGNDIFDPEAEAAAMAAAMGFSSFGQQPTLADSEEPDENGPNGRPSKKRRYNSRVDAYVGPAPQGTGANDVPVQRRAFPPQNEGSEMRNENEISLDGNEINLDDNEEGVATGDTATTIPHVPGLPPKPHFTLPANPALPPKPQPQHFHASDSNQQDSNNSQNHIRDQRGDHGARGGHGVRGGRGGGRGGHAGNNNHTRDPTKPWYTDYYDPSSNENPWERLEEQRGMEAVGVWLPTSSRSGGGRGGRGGFRSGPVPPSDQPVAQYEEGQPSSVQQETY